MRKLLILISLLFLTASIVSQNHVQIPRLNIQYGDSKCVNSIIFWTSLPDRGLVLDGVVITSHTSAPVAIAWIGLNRINIPWMNSFGQLCHFLASPDIVYAVPLRLGYGRIPLFQIPISKILIGLNLYGQAAIIAGNHEDWSRGVEMVIQ